MVKPTFLIMGAQKAGTTSLYSAMRQHPHIGRANKKELHFFDRFYHRGMAWYEKQFRVETQHVQVGESTPVYMYDELVRGRIASDLPDIKILAILRDPVARAYSHFWHSRRFDQESASSFEEALAVEPQRLQEIREQIRQPDANGREGWTYPKVRRSYWWSYVDRGRYVDQLEDLERLFGRDRILVLTLEETKQNPEQQISAALEHIGVDPALHGEYELPRRNTYSKISRQETRRLREEGKSIPSKATDGSYPPIQPATREKLMDEFAEHDIRLKKWLSRGSLPWQSRANH